MPTPYRDELLRRLRLRDPEAGFVDETRLQFSAEGREDVVLDAPEATLAAAVGALGADVRESLWPDATIDAAGFNILLVHLDEVLATRDVTAPLRVTREGLAWPQD